MCVARLSRNDPSDLAFALTALIKRVVSFDDFQLWLDHVVKSVDADKIPYCIFLLMDAKAKPEIDSIVIDYYGFFPTWDGIEDEYMAVNGIGFKRSTEYRTDAASRDEALAALARNPHIEERFRKTFPFIKL